MRDLAPHIHRQRLILEGYPCKIIDDLIIKDYLSRLSVVLDMKELLKPVTHRSDKYGWAGWIHWENSGAHLYAWDEPVMFFSVDIYTCKEFDPTRARDFTKDYFNAIDIEQNEL
jgi:S-adenosylmethionine/arginine decarboxylase-like enzyme